MNELVAMVAGLAALASPASQDGSGPPAGDLLSAFFGLDNSRRIALATLQTCGGPSGNDGMPVIFGQEVDASTLEPEDFRVTTRSGAVGQVGCVTLRPADEPGELRTALVIGRYGSAADQPVRVEVVGDVMSLDGTVNFRGAAVAVTPLEAGPGLVLAESLPLEAWSVGGPDNCPADGIGNIVRATWAGGVRRPGGDEVGAPEAAMYRVALRQPDGSVVTVAPVAIGDLNDNDNNHDLCLAEAGEPLSVAFPAGALVDPNDDLNPDTEIMVSWKSPDPDVASAQQGAAQ
jgi:hypothetical protein